MRKWETHMSNSWWTEIDWVMWQAIGTVAAASFALIFSLRDVITRWRNRPKVVLEKQVTSDRTFIQYNLKITNKGNTTARNINVKIESIIQDNKQIRSGSFPYQINNAIQLQSEEYGFLRLLMVSQNPNSMEIGREGWYIDRQDSTFNILVTGDNISAIRYSYRYVNAIELSQVKLVKK
jgi:hypothetical protein